MTLEERIVRLEDIEAIKQLKARYCEASDDIGNGTKVAELFVEDGVWDGGESMRAEGKAAIKQAFDAAGHVLKFSQHNVMNPIIEIDGDNATGIWQLLGLIDFTDQEQSRLLSVRYEEEYVKLNGVWKYKRLAGQSQFMSTLNAVAIDLPS